LSDIKLSIVQYSVEQPQTSPNQTEGDFLAWATQLYGAFSVKWLIGFEPRPIRGRPLAIMTATLVQKTQRLVAENGAVWSPDKN
jgi:hypothetical protein